MAEVIFHSSGTTGTAKEIRRSEESLAADARQLVASFPDLWQPSLTIVASVRPEHMFGALWRVRAPAIAHCNVDPRIVLSVEELLDARRQYGLFVLITTPSFLEKALTHPDFAALHGAFKAIVTSGSPLRRTTALTVAERTGVCPLEIYGSTETGTVAWRRQSQGEEFTLIEGVTVQRTDDGRLSVDSPFAMTRPFVLNDLVELVAPRRFRLLGRADRQVKILERYVSLSAVEQTLAEHPAVERVRVEPFGEGVQRLGALIVPSAAGLAACVRGSSAALAAELRAFLRGKVVDLAIPRRFRLVRELPTNEQGKTTAAAVRACLSAWCREPMVVRWQTTAESLETELVFPADMECFQGHFPGFPILPGVAQLYFLRHFARQVFPDWPESATYRKLKFQKLIRPNCPVIMKIDRRGEGEFSFSLSIADGPCASGILLRN